MDRPRVKSSVCIKTVGIARLGLAAACAALLSVLAVLSIGRSAHAADQDITATKLLLKSNKLVLKSKDPGIGIAGSDPVGGSDSVIYILNGGSGLGYPLPKTLWKTNGSGTLFQFKNGSAPSGPSPVKVAKVKAGQIKVVADSIPFAVPNGAATIHVVLSLDGGTNTYCMTFSGIGNGSKFLAKDATAGLCCGDNLALGSEACDGTDDAACPGNCLADCTCPVCGNNVKEGSETCDGTDDAACPGNCLANCTCTPPCETAVGGFCWFRGADGDSCDTTCANNARVYDSATSTYAGSAGTAAHCAALSNAFGSGNYDFDLSCSVGAGCIDSGLAAFLRCTSPSTTSGAAEPGYQRICACLSEPKTLFVTSGHTTGYLGGLAAGDSYCQDAANAAGLAGTYKAWLSDLTATVQSRFTHRQGHYQLVDGTVIANNWDDLVSGTLLHPINLDEHGALATDGFYTFVFTGTTISGAAGSDNCSGWNSGLSNATSGDYTETNSGWTDTGALVEPCGSFLRLYCFQQ